MGFRVVTGHTVNMEDHNSGVAYAYIFGWIAPTSANDEQFGEPAEEEPEPVGITLKLLPIG